MRIGIIAEGHADVNIIKPIMKYLTGVECEDMISIRPSKLIDETDNAQMVYSNWELVMNSCCNNNNELDKFFKIEYCENPSDDSAILVVQIDTAERGMKNYNVVEPLRTGHPNWKEYSSLVRENVKIKLENLVPEQYRDNVVYAIAIEETDAWVIPLFDNKKSDSSSYINAKEKLRELVNLSKDKKKFIDTSKKNLNYRNIGRLFLKQKNIQIAQDGNESLNLFCQEVASKYVPQH